MSGQFLIYLVSFNDPEKKHLFKKTKDREKAKTIVSNFTRKGHTLEVKRSEGPFTENTIVISVYENKGGNVIFREEDTKELGETIETEQGVVTKIA